MFRKHQGRRRTNIVFVIFRLILSLFMFAVLLGGVYSAYKHFSGLDPLKMDPQAILSQLLAGRIPEEALSILSSVKVTQGLSDQISKKVLGEQDSKKIPADEDSQQKSEETDKILANAAFKFLLLADSHSDNVNLGKAISQAKQNYPDLKFIIGLGDYTEVGTVAEMNLAKKELDSAGLRYFLLAGDHDLWDSRDKSLFPAANFKQVFGPIFQSFVYEGFRFVLLYNSDNYSGFDDEQLKWLENELEKGKGEKGIFVFVHTPFFHPSSDHVMGRVEKSLKLQAERLIFQLKEAGVKRVFAGDVHFFSQYSEPKTDLSMVTIGAVTIERNPQVPRFAVVTVLEDGSTKVEDVEIK